jgi:hypothetical protein
MNKVTTYINKTIAKLRLNDMPEAVVFARLTGMLEGKLGILVGEIEAANFIDGLIAFYRQQDLSEEVVFARVVGQLEQRLIAETA